MRLVKFVSLPGEGASSRRREKSRVLSWISGPPVPFERGFR